MRAIFFFLIALLTASPAAALSCLPPDAVRLYERARDSDLSYWIVQGRLRPLETVREPEPDSLRPASDPPSADTRAQVLGRVLIGDGSFHPFARNITVRLTCLSEWCGSFPADGTEIIAAIEVTDRDPRLTIGPCGGDYVEFSEDGLERLLECHRSGNCALAE